MRMRALALTSLLTSLLMGVTPPVAAQEVAPTASLEVRTSRWNGSQWQPTTEAWSAENVTLDLQYEVSNLAGRRAVVEVDLCDPIWTYSTVSGGAFAYLTSCLNGWRGGPGYRYTSSLIEAAPGAVGATGHIAITIASAAVLNLEGTVWQLPARVRLEGETTPLAQTTAALTLRTRPADFGVAKGVVGRVAATRPGGTESGTNVTYRVGPRAPYYSPLGAQFLEGTLTVTDPTPAGATLVPGSARRVGQRPDWSPYPRADELALVTGYTLTETAAGVQMSVDNFFGYVSLGDTSLEIADFEVTYWYPSGTEYARNAATLSWNGQTRDASTALFLGNVGAVVSLTHWVANIGWTKTAAHQPNLNDSPAYFTGPQGLLFIGLRVRGYNANGGGNLLNPDLVLELPPDTSLDRVYLDPASTEGWTLSTSSTVGCADGTFTPVPAADVNAVRCVRAQYAGGLSTEKLLYVSTRLREPTRSQLLAEPGAYRHVTASARLRAENIDQYYFQRPDGQYDNVTQLSPLPTTSDIATFWNAEAPGVDAWGASWGGIGDPSNPLWLTPWGGNVRSAGYTNLTLRVELPRDVELVGAPHEYGGRYILTDDAGTPILPICTTTPEDATRGAIVECTWPGHIPAFVVDPFVACPNDPWSCIYNQNAISADGTRYVQNQGGIVTPLRIRSGQLGQTIYGKASAWTSAGSGGVYGNGTLAAASASNPTVGWFPAALVAGRSQLEITHTASPAEVPSGSAVEYTIGYRNTGNVPTSDTYVYDLFGVDARSETALPSFCSPLRPVLTGVAHVAGSPAPDVEYTTNTPPTRGGTWAAFDETVDLATVTGLRFRLRSAFSATAGRYGPNDQPGQEKVSLRLPGDARGVLCNVAAVAANELTPAGVLAQASVLLRPSEPCTDNAQCYTGACVPAPSGGGSLCCASRCVGPCESCFASEQIAGGQDGVCRPRPTSVVCRASAGACDVAESCTGTTGACPDDVKVAAGTLCEAAVGGCELDAVCDGASAACPDTQPKPPQTTCRVMAGVCDVAELCDGVAKDCPSDALVAAGTVCGQAAGECYETPLCSGNSVTCAPPDTPKATGTTCSSGACNNGACVPVDVVVEIVDKTLAPLPYEAELGGNVGVLSQAGQWLVNGATPGTFRTTNDNNLLWVSASYAALSRGYWLYQVPTMVHYGQSLRFDLETGAFLGSFQSADGSTRIQFIADPLEVTLRNVDASGAPIDHTDAAGSRVALQNYSLNRYLVLGGSPQTTRGVGGMNQLWTSSSYGGLSRGWDLGQLGLRIVRGHTLRLDVRTGAAETVESQDPTRTEIHFVYDRLEVVVKNVDKAGNHIAYDARFGSVVGVYDQVIPRYVVAWPSPSAQTVQLAAGASQVEVLSAYAGLGGWWQLSSTPFKVERGYTILLDVETGAATRAESPGVTALHFVYDPMELELKNVDRAGNHIAYDPLFGSVVGVYDQMAAKYIVAWPSGSSQRTTLVSGANRVELNTAYAGLGAWWQLSSTGFKLARDHTLKLDVETGAATQVASPGVNAIHFVYEPLEVVVKNVDKAGNHLAYDPQRGSVVGVYDYMVPRYVVPWPSGSSQRVTLSSGAKSLEVISNYGGRGAWWALPSTGLKLERGYTLLLDVESGAATRVTSATPSDTEIRFVYEPVTARVEAFDACGTHLTGAVLNVYSYSTAAYLWPWAVGSPRIFEAANGAKGFYVHGIWGEAVWGLELSGTPGLQKGMTLFLDVATKTFTQVANDTGDARVVYLFAGCSKKPPGGPCAANQECMSGVCVVEPGASAGICCDRACDGACESCRAANQVAGGQDGTCGVRPATVVCRASTGACDAAERCDGATGQCPGDAKVSAGTVCQQAAAACETDAVCDGTHDACPATSVRGAGEVCRGATDACDAAERCDGASKQCPEDALATAGTPCGVAAGECWAAPLCSGSGATCPASEKLADGTACSGGTCVDGACNKPPIANAGPDQGVDEKASVTLDGTASSDPDGDPLTFVWAQTGGPPVTLSDSTAAQPTFTAPTVTYGGATLTFALVVFDGHASSAPDTVNVSIQNVDHPPVAIVLPHAPVLEGTRGVCLDGTKSYDPDGDDTLAYTWTQVGGASVPLAGITTATPCFDAPYVGPAGDVLTFTLVVCETAGKLCSEPATGSVLVEDVNHPPVADAGAPQTKLAGATVTLDGRKSSDPDNDPLTYAWTQEGGPTVSLLGATSAQPTFVAPAESAVLTFCLVVSDGQLSSETSCTTVTLRASNTLPSCDGATASGPGLWPPNHKMVAVGIAGVTDPDGDPVQVTIDRVFQDEPINGLGDGDTGPDAAFAGADRSQVLVRAERTGTPRVPGNGRVYHVGFTASDGRGGRCTGTVALCVPHDQSPQRRNCIDDGPRYDSFGR